MNFVVKSNFYEIKMNSQNRWGICQDISVQYLFHNVLNMLESTINKSRYSREEILYYLYGVVNHL